VLGVGKAIDKKVWEDIVSEIDLDGNGDIDFEEFSQMMQALLKKEIPEDEEGEEEEEDE
jgi:Ca2+-binding EF-hand superfamily protein